MKLLLDTHTLIWYLEQSNELPSSCKAAIENTSEAFVSIATLWEIAVKMNIRKLTLKSEFRNLEVALKETYIDILPISFADTKHYLSLPLHHRDPFDRMLISQALERDLTVASKDEAFDAYGVARLWENLKK
jgi:PIN domain nuclease of toxin-antitoxin system